MKSTFLMIGAALAIALTFFLFAYAEKNSEGKGLLLVANQGDHTLSMIDPDAGTLVAKVTSNEIRGHEVAASPDGRFAYLPIYGDSGVGLPGTNGSKIEVIDIAKKSIAATIDLGRPVRPHWARFGPDGLLYVSAELENSIDVVDPKTQKRIGSIPTGQAESHMVVITKDGKRAYTSNVGPGTVSVIDLVARKVVTVIPVAQMAQRIAISVDDKLVFTADQHQARLAIIDTSANKVIKWIDLPSVGYGSAPTPDGKWLVVAMPGANKVAIVDLAEMKVARTVDLPARPQEVLMRSGQAVAYVSCSGDGKVAAIDLKDWHVSKVMDSGPGADGLAWAGN